MRKKDPNSETVSHSPTDTPTILQRTGAFRSSVQTCKFNTWPYLITSLVSSARVLLISLSHAYCLHPFLKVQPIPPQFLSAPTLYSPLYFHIYTCFVPLLVFLTQEPYPSPVLSFLIISIPELTTCTTIPTFISMVCNKLPIDKILGEQSCKT